MVTPLETILRLTLASMLSGAIGLEREYTHRAAGLRTHMLVGVGSALFSMMSLNAFNGEGDRVAAQVVTGVGFLGAGAIFRHGSSVHGLTTAAGVWAVAAIGMTVGVGEEWIATVATGVTLAVLTFFRAVEWVLRGWDSAASVVIGVRVPDRGRVDDVIAAAASLRARNSRMSIQEMGQDGVSLRIRLSRLRADTVMQDLDAIPGVERVYRVEN